MDGHPRGATSRRASCGLLGHPARDRRGIPHHLRRGPDLEPDLRRRSPRPLGASANVVHVPSDFVDRVDPEMRGWAPRRQGAQRRLRQLEDQALVPGFVATIPFHEGIARTIAWFEADPSRWVVKPEVHAAMDRVIAAWETAASPLRGPRAERARPAGRGSGGSVDDRNAWLWRQRTVGRSALGTRHSALGTRHSALGTRHSALGTRHSALGTRHSALE